MRTIYASCLVACLCSAACAGSDGPSLLGEDSGPGAAGETGNVGASGATSGAGSGTSLGSGGNAGSSGGAGSTAGTVSVEHDGGASAADAAGPAADGGIEPRGTGPGDWVAGDYPKDLSMQTYLELKDLPNQAGAARQYKVHVPPSYTPEVPTPVVFCFHGLSQNAVMFCVDGAGMPAKADAEGFILVMPNGYQNSWNAGTCCGGAASSKLDDVGFVRALFEEVGKHLNVDLARVYATGLSNGAYMSYRLACQAADIFVAVAPGAGAIGMNDIGGGTSATGDFSECKPSAKVSVLDLHGTADSLIAYSLQKPSLERIATANGCKLTTHAAAQPASGGDTACVSYEGCPSGVDVTGCTVMNGGHVWFGSDSCGTGAGPAGCGFVGANSTMLNNTDEAWEFFRAHAR